MAKKNTYWKKRFAALEEERNIKVNEIYENIKEAHKEAIVTMQIQINNWYHRIAENEKITIEEAKELLNKKELEEFKWDVKKYIKISKETLRNLEDATSDTDIREVNYVKQLENASARVHITRLEELQTRATYIADKLYTEMETDINNLILDIYKDTNYKTYYEIQKGVNKGFLVDPIDTKKLKTLLKKPWAIDGKNFSERIWTNRTKLVNTLHKEFLTMTLTGDSPDKAIKNIAKAFEVSKANAGRLVMTEAAYFGTLAQKECFNELDVEKYEISATLDLKTSEICQNKDGEVYNMEDFETGVTAPPFHPNCRTAIVPYFEDEFALTTRIARKYGGSGGIEYIPSNIKYSEWYEKYVLPNLKKIEEEKKKMKKEIEI